MASDDDEECYLVGGELRHVGVFALVARDEHVSRARDHVAQVAQPLAAQHLKLMAQQRPTVRLTHTHTVADESTIVASYHIFFWY